MARTTGTVKWFSENWGYGFIQRDDGPDVFVHYAAIEGRGFRTLRVGEVVEFDIVDTGNGLEARNVTRSGATAQHEQRRTSRERRMRHAPAGGSRAGETHPAP